MNDFTVPEPDQLVAIMKRTGLTSREFGEAVGYSDAERTIRGMVKGDRHGKPYRMSGTAVHSLAYMLALAKVVDAYHDFMASDDETTEGPLADAITDATALLPRKLTP